MKQPNYTADNGRRAIGRTESEREHRIVSAIYLCVMFSRAHFHEKGATQNITKLSNIYDTSQAKGCYQMEVTCAANSEGCCDLRQHTSI